jgi:glycosyltransferase involved in cell wall biosynthesis
MKVCLVGPAYPFRGGISHFTTLLAREFEQEHEVLNVNFKRLYPSVFFPGKTQFDESDSPLVTPSERLIDSINPFTYIKAARRIMKFSPDLVVFQWWHPFFALSYFGMRCFLPKRLHQNIVYLCHNVVPHESTLLDRMLMKLGYAGVRAFLVQSQEDEKQLMKMKPSARVNVHPHPIYDVFRRGEVSREEAREKIGIGGRVILFFGYIRQYKGLELLLEAFALASRTIKAKLLIVGEFYEDRGRYDDMIRELGIESEVSIIDRYVPNEEVEVFFQASDLVALPYLSATQSGIVQVAFGFNRPVVVTAVGGLPDVVDDGKTGFIVPPRDAEALADALVRFFKENRGPDMERAIDGAKERFSWKRCTESLIDLVR